MRNKGRKSIHTTVGFIIISMIKESFIKWEGDFIATFGVNNTPIYML